MNKKSANLERLVVEARENGPDANGHSTNRARRARDHAFMAIMGILAPRIRYFTRTYGLMNHADDAEQVAALAVCKAIDSYDPEVALFTTYVNWPIKAEFQALRFRLFLDTRPASRKVGAVTIALDSTYRMADGTDVSLADTLVDEAALEQVEAGASAYLAREAIEALIDRHEGTLRSAAYRSSVRKSHRSAGSAQEETFEDAESRIARNREIIERRIFDRDTLDEIGRDTEITKERVRQITKSAGASLAKIAATHPRFALMASMNSPAVAATKPRGKNKAAVADQVSLLPAVAAPHNVASTVTAIMPDRSVSYAHVPSHSDQRLPAGAVVPDMADQAAFAAMRSAKDGDGPAGSRAGSA